MFGQCLGNHVTDIGSTSLFIKCKYLANDHNNYLSNFLWSCPNIFQIFLKMSVKYFANAWVIMQEL